MWMPVKVWLFYSQSNFLANALGKSSTNGLDVWVAATHVEDLGITVLAHDFGLVHQEI